MSTNDTELLKVILQFLESRSKAEQIIKRYYRDKITIVWKTEDVHRAANERELALTEKEALQVLQTLHDQHNPQLGLRWKDIWGHIEAYVLGRKLTKREIQQFVKNDKLTIQR
jgi:IS30 family transposase